MMTREPVIIIKCTIKLTLFENELLIPAFLLTRQWSDDKTGLRLDLWLSSAQGPLAVSIHQQRALFFIRQSEQMAATTLLGNIRGVSVKPLELKTFPGQAVSAVYFDSQQQLYRARDRFTQNDIACFEADIRPTERFLCERFITASVDVDADYSSEVLHNIRLQPGDYTPEFEVMSLDIESDYESDTLFSIAFVSSEVKRVLMIGDGQDNDLIEYVADERCLLLRWIEWVERIDPDILIGWNVVNFDLRLLQKRAQAFSLPLAIGRKAALPVWRQSQADSSHHFVLIPGRVVLDGIDTLRSATYNFPSFALDSVARELLGRGKLIHGINNADPLYKAKEIKTGALNTVHTGNYIFIESTAEGPSGLFHDICQDSIKIKEEGRRLMKSEFKFHFFPWFDDFRYVLNDESIKYTEIETDYFYDLEHEENIILSAKQKNWYVLKWRQQKLGGEDNMSQEYPSTPEEVFDVRMDCSFFSPESIDACFTAKLDEEETFINIDEYKPDGFVIN